MKLLILRLIKIYQKAWPTRFFAFGFSCRFRPTCSQYTYQAIESYGIIRGGLMGIRRLFRCHPWSEGGWDPVK